jgi:hypothetical protein
MSRLVQVLAIAAVVPIAFASAAAAEPPTAVTVRTLGSSLTPAVPANVAPRVELRPAVVTAGEQATITVSGVHARSVEVRLVAADPLARALPWQSLRLFDGAWVGTLPAPTRLGVYPVVLRTTPGGPLFRSQRFLLRVFDPGTRARPAFDNPVDVVRWWVRTVPHATLVALKSWPRPAFDQRDVRLHRQFVIAYSLPGLPQVSDRLGMFITAFRDGYGAPWRLLEATVEP